MRAVLLSFLLAAGVAFAAETTTEPGSEAPGSDAPVTIRELIERVRDGGAMRQQELEARERRFLEARDERASLLEGIRRQRREAEDLADRLRAAFEAGEDELADLETTLDESSADLRDVFAAVNQVSADSLASLQNSMVSAEISGREPLLEKLSSSETLPSAVELRELWLLLLEEMHESGRVSRFEADIIAANGEEQTRSVTRIGTFTALSEGDYLRFLPESGRLLALARQPAGTSRGDAVAFEQADAELITVALDPSRGAILSLIVQTPEFRERLAQGGVIGYIIIALGVIGLALGVERLLHVAYASSRTKRALTGGDDEHAIGQLRLVASDPDYQADADALSAKIDEILTNASLEIESRPAYHRRTRRSQSPAWPVRHGDRHD